MALSVTVVTEANISSVSVAPASAVALASTAPLPLVPDVSTSESRVAMATAGLVLPLSVTVIAPLLGEDPMARNNHSLIPLTRVLVTVFSWTNVRPLPDRLGVPENSRLLMATRTSSLLPGVQDANVIFPVVAPAEIDCSTVIAIGG